MWQLVLGNVATLQEIERHWSLDDMIRAHLAFSFKARLEARATGGRR